jgi:hypothetical protein
MARKITRLLPEPPPEPADFLAVASGEMPLPPLPHPVDWPPAETEPNRMELPPPPANKHGAPRRRQAIVPRKKTGT